jgi:hypothetical protein
MKSHHVINLIPVFPITVIYPIWIDPLAVILLHQKSKKGNLLCLIVADLWKPGSVLLQTFPLFSQQGAASLYASVPSAIGCYVLFVFFLDLIGSPLAFKQLDSILVSFWLALGIKLLSVVLKSWRIQGLGTQYFTQDTVYSLPSFFIEDRLSSLVVTLISKLNKDCLDAPVQLALGKDFSFNLLLKEARTVVHLLLDILLHQNYSLNIQK